MTKIKLQELLEFLNGYLKIHDFKDYGPNGLQVEGKKHIDKVAFSTTASLEIIQEAIQKGANCLVVHHGLFWDKDSKVISGPLYQKLKALIHGDVSLLAYHLPLDAHREVGNNAMILKTLGIEYIEPFEIIGAKGVVNMTKENILGRLKAFFDIEPICPPCHLESIKTIACVSGGGHTYFKKILDENIDAFISGTADEWVWDFAKENNKLFIPLGHYKSETIGIKALKDHVEKVLGLETLYFESKNPY